MNGTDLLGCIGHADEGLVDEALSLSPAPAKAVAPARGKKGAVRKIIIIAAACLAVAMSVGVYALHTVDPGQSPILRFLKGNPDSDNHTDLYFRPVGNVEKIGVRELKGDVRKLESVIRSQYKNFPVFSSQSPSLCEQTFDSTDVAEQYIGFSGLSFPKIAAESESVKVTAAGTEKGSLTFVRLTAGYKPAPGVTATSTAMIFTENYSGDIGMFITSFSDAFEGVDFSGGEKTVNGKVFYEAQSSPFGNEWLTRWVFRYENRVLYSLFVRFREADSEAAESLASEWMNKF